MSINKNDQRSREMRDPSKDEYLELEKRLGRAEYELVADIAAGDKELGDAAKAARQRTKAAIGDIRRSRGGGRG